MIFHDDDEGRLDVGVVDAGRQHDGSDVCSDDT